MQGLETPLRGGWGPGNPAPRLDSQPVVLCSSWQVRCAPR